MFPRPGPDVGRIWAESQPVAGLLLLCNEASLGLFAVCWSVSLFSLHHGESHPSLSPAAHHQTSRRRTATVPRGEHSATLRPPPHFAMFRLSSCSTTQVLWVFSLIMFQNRSLVLSGSLADDKFPCRGKILNVMCSPNLSKKWSVIHQTILESQRSRLDHKTKWIFIIWLFTKTFFLLLLIYTISWLSNKWFNTQIKFERSTSCSS